MTSPNTIWKSLTIPPPVMGWNTRDPLVGMDQLYAVDIENYFPGNGEVALRNGYLLHSSSVGTGAVTGLNSLEYGSVSKFFACAINAGVLKAFDVTSSPATDISGGVVFGSATCQFLQFQDRLFIVPAFATGVVDVYHWTGTGNIAASAFTGPGGDDKDLLAIGSYKERLYFGQMSAPSIWYAAKNAITGALTEFPLNSYLTKGPTMILFCGSVSSAKFSSEESLFCICTQAGEILVYRGDYPGSVSWQIVGSYTIPPPVGPKAFFYSGSDLNIVTRLGIMSVSKMLSGNYSGIWPSLSEVVESAFLEAYADTPTSFYKNIGIAYPKGKYILANYEASASDDYNQIVMNTTTSAWTLFSNQNAQSWGIWNGNLYFGDSNAKVFKADTGYFDDGGSGEATNRATLLRPAYNYLGNPELLKKFRQVIPTMYESEGLNNVINVDVDFARTDPSSSTNAVVDTTDTSYKLYQPTVALTGYPGSAGSIVFKDTVTTKRRSIQALKVFYTEGDAF